MKKLRYLTLTAGLALALPNLAAAETVEEQIVRQLQDQGFTRIEVQRTFLGRVRIEALSTTLERELVFNPVTGEILRDYWEPRDDDNDEGSVPILRNPSGSDSGSRDRDDDDRRTNAGSGSANSGSGNADEDEDDDDDDDEDDDDDDDDEDDDDDDDDDEDEN